MNRRTTTLFRAIVLCLALALLPVGAAPAEAHQPFFEEQDSDLATPLTVADPQISTALYATLDPPGDVDFVTFHLAAPARILVGMTVPRIEGQADFAPTLAVIGPGLPPMARDLLPNGEARSLLDPHQGGTTLTPVAGIPFHEPFSRTDYWRRQRARLSLVAGTYTAVVWHAESRSGRYVLVVGEREVAGGDPLFPLKLTTYWTPVEPVASAPAPDPVQEPCSWFRRILARLLGVPDACPPAAPQGYNPGVARDHP